MEIQTNRLVLRPWQESDAEALFKYASDPDVGPRAGWPPHKDIEESRTVIRDIFANDRTWAIVLKETGEAIGCMGYYVHGESNIEIGEEDAEIGYWLAKPYWNQGLCTEALIRRPSYRIPIGNRNRLPEKERGCHIRAVCKLWERQEYHSQILKIKVSVKIPYLFYLKILYIFAYLK